MGILLRMSVGLLVQVAAWAGWCRADGPPGPPFSAGFRIRESAFLGHAELLREIDGLRNETGRESGLWAEACQEAARKCARLETLERRGVATEVEVHEAARQLRVAESSGESVREFAALLAWMRQACQEASVTPSTMGSAQIHLCLPGITQRVGAADYFTLILKGDERLRDAGARAGRAGAGAVRTSVQPAPLTEETAALAASVLRFRSEAGGEIQVRRAFFEDARRRLRLVEEALGKGVANEVERDEARVRVNLAESACREADAAASLAQLEWTRFQHLSGHASPASGSQEKSAVGPEVGIAELSLEFRARLGSHELSALALREFLRTTRELFRRLPDRARAAEARQAAQDELRQRERLRFSRPAEVERARMKLDLASAEARLAEDRWMEKKLEWEHQWGLCLQDPEAEGEPWSLPNAAAWGKKMASLEAEITGHRKDQAEIRWRHEQKRLQSLTQVRGGAATAYECHRQALTCRFAEGCHESVAGALQHLATRVAFLDEVRQMAWIGASSSLGQMPERAWSLLASYAAAEASPCPGRLQQLEAAGALAVLRRDELLRLQDVGLARLGELRESAARPELLRKLEEREQGRRLGAEAARNLVTEAAVAARVPVARGARAPARDIELPPLP